MTVVIAAAAAVALILLIAIMALGRSRSDDEVDRFRHVSELTSAWSRQSNVTVAKPAPIDLRDSGTAAGRKPTVPEPATAEHVTGERLEQESADKRP